MANLATVERAPEAPQRESDLSQPVLPDQPLWAQFGRIGGNLDPAQVTGILRDADIGRTQRLVDLVHDCRQKDAHLQAILSRREQAVAGLELRVLAPKGSLKRDRKVADRLQRAIEEAMGFRETLAHLVGEPLLFGHGTTEIIWDRAADGLLVPVHFKRISPRRFGFRIVDGALLFDPTIAGWGDVNVIGLDIIALHPAGKFLQRRRRVNGDVPFREGLARVLAWMSIFRNWDLRDWLSLAEIGWKPWRIGQYGKDATSEDRDGLARIMRVMTATGVAIINKDTTSIDIEWPKGLPSGSVSTHKELADYLGAEMSKAVLTGTLTVEAGSKGARSLGETHQEGLDEMIGADALDISDILTRQLAGPFTRMNYGDRYAVPHVLLPCEDEFDAQTYALTVKTLSDAGLRMPAAFVREQIGIPEPDEDDEIIGEAKPGQAEGESVPAEEPGVEPAEVDKRVRRRSAWRARSRIRR